MKRAPIYALLALALFLVLPGLAAAQHDYVGVDGCKKCHIKEWRSWQETKMANTWEVLKPGERAEAKKEAGLDPDKDYTTDETCVRCHVTGYGEEGGWVDIETTPGLAGVSCEACHGPGGTYTQDGYMTLKNRNYKLEELVKVGLVGEITEEQCVGCHNADSPFVGDDYVFDFEAKKDEGTHEVFPLKYEH